jgi:hypothetical protein
MIELEKFCHESKEIIGKPWSAGDYSYATDGFLAVRVPRESYIPENSDAPDMSKLLWDHESLNDWQSLPVYDLAALKDCTLCKGTKKARRCYECDGDGELTVESHYHEYDVTCKSCRGQGTLPGDPEDDEDPVCDRCAGTGKSASPIGWGAGFVSTKMLEKIKDLPAVKMSLSGNGRECWRFIFIGGVGIVMPMMGA